ncbi:MAG: hypothetical protein ACSLFI_09070 [Solirubrobacterales bacterium]
MRENDELMIAERLEGTGVSIGDLPSDSGSGETLTFKTPEGEPAWRLSTSAGTPGEIESGKGGTWAICRLLGDDGERPAEADWAMIIAYAVPEPELEELDAWYVDEHIEMLLRCPDWLRTRRYEILQSVNADWNRLVVHSLASPDVLGSPEVRESMATPWRQSFASRPWFLTGGRDPVRLVTAP